MSDKSAFQQAITKINKCIADLSEEEYEALLDAYQDKILIIYLEVAREIGNGTH